MQVRVGIKGLQQMQSIPTCCPTNTQQIEVVECEPTWPCNMEPHWCVGASVCVSCCSHGRVSQRAGRVAAPRHGRRGGRLRTRCAGRPSTSTLRRRPRRSLPVAAYPGTARVARRLRPQSSLQQSFVGDTGSRQETPVTDTVVPCIQVYWQETIDVANVQIKIKKAKN